MLIKDFFKIISFSFLFYFVPVGLLAQGNEAFDLQDNRALVEQLIEKGIIDEDECNVCCNYLYHILEAYFDTHYAKHDVIAKADLIKIVNQLKEIKLTSETVIKVLDGYKSNPKVIEKDSLESILKTAAFYDQLNDLNVRRMIVKKFEKSPYSFNNYDEASENYLKDEIGLTDFLGDIRYLKKMSYDTLRTNEAFFEKVKSVFNSAFGDYDIDLMFARNGSAVTVSTPTSSYKILKSDFVWSFISESDNVRSDYNFYETLIPIISQVSADVNQNLLFGFVELSEILHVRLPLIQGEFDYENNIEVGGFLQCIPRNKHDGIVWKDVFALKSNHYCIDVIFQLPLYVPTDWKKQYISRESKVKYFELLATKPDWDKELYSGGYQSLLLDQPKDLASFLRSVKGLKFSEYQNNLGMEHYFPKGKTCNLELCKPELFKFFEYDFDVEEVSFYKGNLNFKYQNNDYSCSAYASSFWKEISAIFQKEERAKQIYVVSDRLGDSDHYYYLNRSEKEILEHIFGMKLPILNKIDTNKPKGKSRNE